MSLGAIHTLYTCRRAVMSAVYGNGARSTHGSMAWMRTLAKAHWRKTALICKVREGRVLVVIAAGSCYVDAR